MFLLSLFTPLMSGDRGDLSVPDPGGFRGGGKSMLQRKTHMSSTDSCPLISSRLMHGWHECKVLMTPKLANP